MDAMGFGGGTAVTAGGAGDSAGADDGDAVAPQLLEDGMVGGGIGDDPADLGER